MYHFHLHPSSVSQVLNGLTIGGKESSPSEDATKRAARSSSRRWKARKKQEIVFDILYTFTYIFSHQVHLQARNGLGTNILKVPHT